MPEQASQSLDAHLTRVLQDPVRNLGRETGAPSIYGIGKLEDSP